MNSILEDIKQMLNLERDYTPFDTDVQIYINSAFGNLYQLGSITGYEETWDDVPLVRKQAQEIKVYIYLYTRLRFDPPANSFVIEAIEKQISEAEWRLNVEAEGAFES